MHQKVGHHVYHINSNYTLIRRFDNYAFPTYSAANMFERLARQEEREGAVRTQTQDVFKEATEEELRHKEQSEPNEKKQTSLPVDNQVTSSTEVNSQQDVEMKEDEKGGLMC